MENVEFFFFKKKKYANMKLFSTECSQNIKLVEQVEMKKLYM